jgi:hypothetical protein
MLFLSYGWSHDRQYEGAGAPMIFLAIAYGAGLGYLIWRFAPGFLHGE